MPQATLGILITYYNERELLKECLESISRQSVPPDEIIIYDDCSDFPAADYTIDGLKVDIIRGKVNQGLGFARNVLMNNSKCEYVHCHDADDLFSPLWCEKTRGVIARENPDIIITGIESFDKKGFVCEDVMNLKNIRFTQDLLSFSIMEAVLVASSVFRREIALNIGGFKTRERLGLGEDFDFHVRLINRCRSYSIIPERLMLKYLREKSLSSDKELACESIIKSTSQMKEEIPASYHIWLSENCISYGSRLFHLGAKDKAREAFRLALSLGKPRFIVMRRLYRIIARIIGPMYTEYLAAIYRRALPKKIRVYLARRGF